MKRNFAEHPKLTFLAAENDFYNKNKIQGIYKFLVNKFCFTFSYSVAFGLKNRKKIEN